MINYLSSDNSVRTGDLPTNTIINILRNISDLLKQDSLNNDLMRETEIIPIIIKLFFIFKNNDNIEINIIILSIISLLSNDNNMNKNLLKKYNIIQFIIDIFLKFSLIDINIANHSFECISHLSNDKETKDKFRENNLIFQIGYIYSN